MSILRLLVDLVEAIAWPIVFMCIVLMFRSEIRLIVAKLKRAELPGGFSFETVSEQIAEAKAVSIEVTEERRKTDQERDGQMIPLNEVNARMLSLGLAPSPSGLDVSYYREIAATDHNLAMAGLRIEIETMLRNLAKGFKVSVAGTEDSETLARKLEESGAITPRQTELVLSILRLGNAAVHGIPISRQQTEQILQIAQVLNNEYRAWLTWGFDDDWMRSR